MELLKKGCSLAFGSRRVQSVVTERQSGHLHGQPRSIVWTGSEAELQNLSARLELSHPKQGHQWGPSVQTYEFMGNIAWGKMPHIGCYL